MMHLRIRKALLCCSIALNALCAGGMFTFPLISPTLGTHCKLTQPQLTTVILGGMMSQYTIAALVGWVSDQFGPAVCSLVAALLFSGGYGGFAWEIYKTPEDISEPISGALYRLIFYFVLAGLGTLFSYYSAIFSASRAFPNHLGLASGVTMAFFGISPLFFSVIASAFFTDEISGSLNVTRYMTFLALLTAIVYVAGFIFLRPVSRPTDIINIVEADGNSRDGLPDETTPLLSEPTSSTPVKPPNPSLLQLFKTCDFWLLALFCVLVLGSCEMIMSNMGTIVVSLSSSGSTSGGTLRDSSTALQVNLLAASNTITRIIVGPLADWISPVALYLPSGLHIFPRKHRISRFAFLTGPAILLVLTYSWMAFAVKNLAQLWLLSVGIGSSYSAVFTVLPSLILSLWGTENMARNFGLMMYAPFLGTPLFSYLYAFVSAEHAGTESGGLCVGPVCWHFTFIIAITTSAISSVISVLLWRRWKDRI